MTVSRVQDQIQSLAHHSEGRHSFYYRHLDVVDCRREGGEGLTLSLPNDVMVKNFRRDMVRELESALQPDLGDRHVHLITRGTTQGRGDSVNSSELAPPVAPSSPPTKGGASKWRSSVNSGKTGSTAHYENRYEKISFCPSMTLDRFVPGQANRIALAAARQVSQSLGTGLNPLFLYGGVGLGKTHLLNGIGHEVQKQDPDASIVYVSSEHFLNDFHTSIKTHRMKEFRARYRKCALLMIDDVQFMEQWEKTQEELFNIFNQLQMSGGQMVFTSDRPPSELSRLTDRLLSRLSSGLVLELRAPDFLVRQKLLEGFFTQSGLKIASPTLERLAEKVEGSVRQMQSVAKTLAFWAAHDDPHEWSDDRIASILGDVFQYTPSSRKGTDSPGPATPLAADRIASFVAGQLGVPLKSMLSGGRTRLVVRARQVAMFLCRNFTDMSFVELGQFFGGKSHTTAMKAIQRLEVLMGEDEELREYCREMERTLAGVRSGEISRLPRVAVS